MSWLQALIIGLLYYLSDAPWFFGEGYYCLQRPIVAGFLTGLVMGDPVTGTIIGATINLIYLGHLNVGGSMPSDMAIAGYIGTALALATGVSTEVALAIAVPLGLLGTIWWVGKMTIDSFFVHWADSYAAKGDAKGVILMNWLPSNLMMLVLKLIVAMVILMAGVPLMESFLNVIQGTNILNALNVVGGVLPALGIGLNLRAILKGETLPFLLIGFLLVSYFSVSIVGVALFGLAFSLIYLQLNKKEDASYGG
ncbi:PTS sugar transporter subunit IIC [Pseudoflavonifractor sp. MSJ-37]|uniref:PTS mannose/fructose/sorbose/N-acetylgalactosamine transporter subunit IIC n=1 Tax=Pseudoflavonifractor sp. MSJ-37 TaxID=2841531 RepID=UPI001C116E07|nr:PTS sugar transporter subunit IIC [Pseudoflavonifractor sp. MSJ-37]MBU5435077.1 PTS sugar transporter subunit IIC [Pseudoflavonifractor sp. MSJ-37]